jgi:NADH-quinone oxidoreductase subunit H
VYGIVLAGWSSNSKYPFLGGVRASSQMISYEMSLGLSVIPVLMVCGDLNLVKISAYQDANGWMLLPLWGNGLSIGRWMIWIPMTISFVVFVISMFAETNRLPFDMAECETELVAGYHTEYSSMKFALFFMGEYAAMIIGSGMAVTLFLGGWSIPFGPWLSAHLPLQFHFIAGHTPLYLGVAHMLCFAFKVLLFILFFVIIRWSIPRFRFDQLMKLGWLYLFEIALANVLLTAALMIFFPLH